MLQEDGELTGGCYPIGTADDIANCTRWGDVVASCPRLSKGSFTLSFAGTSYGDIDKGLAYNTSAVQSGKENIDLVAYLDASNVIKNPCDVSTIGYLNCGWPAFYSIPAKYHAALRTATIASDIKQFLGADDAISDYEVDEISISSGTAFAVLSTEGELYVVIITSADTQSRSVTLEFYNPLL
jgi:hypothetical protein